MGRLVAFALGVIAIGACDASTTQLPRWTLHRADRPSEDVVLPAHLDVAPHPTRYTLTSRVVVPEADRGRALVLVVPSLPAPVHLTVDGAEAPTLHEPRAGHRALGPQRFAISADATQDGELALALEVEHRWTQAAWWTVVPSLALAGRDDPRARRNAWVNDDAAAVSFAALVQIAFVCFGVFLLDRRRTEYLVFGVQMAGAAAYPLYVVGWLDALVGTADVAVLAVGLHVASVASVFFTHVYFGLRPASRVWWGVLVVGVLVSAIGHGPFVSTYAGALTAVVVIAIAALYQLVACAKLIARSEDRAGAVLLGIAWLMLSGTAWCDLSYWAGGPDVAQGARLAVFGLALFACFMAFLLARRHITSLNDGDRLNTELAARVAELERRAEEIQSLNVELRRQIGERSNQIVAALALGRAPTAPGPQLVAGDLVEGRYRVIEKIGTGGMGAVYEVERQSDGRRLALKVTHDLDASALARLAREARIATSIRNPHVVDVLDVDVSSQGFLFVVMELVRGATLRDRRARFGDRDWAVPILAQIADGLAALHEAGVVHRDLKPANVLLTGDEHAPTVRIADFGVSRLEDLATEDATVRVRSPAPMEDATERLGPRDVVSSSDVRASAMLLTHPGDIPGTPLYMAPESLSGQVATVGDVFGFGVLAFEVLTGRRPFDESLALALLEGRDLPAPPPLSSLAPDVDPTLAALVTRCLSRSPTGRPTARELAIAFQRSAATG